MAYVSNSWVPREPRTWWDKLLRRVTYDHVRKVIQPGQPTITYVNGMLQEESNEVS